MRAAHVAVVGIGGVGSWAAEALARSGVGALTLIDLDHVAESNINRQVQALGSTLGRPRSQALRERIADIHPGCVVHAVEEFVDADNWPALLPAPVDAVIDACDQVRAKAAMAAWALADADAARVRRRGRRQARCRSEVEVADLADGHARPAARRAAPAPAQAPRRAAQRARSACACVFSREPVALPAGCERRLRRRRQPQLPRLRLERRASRRPSAWSPRRALLAARGARSRAEPGATRHAYNRGLWQGC